MPRKETIVTVEYCFKYWDLESKPYEMKVSKDIVPITFYKSKENALNEFFSREINSIIKFKILSVEEFEKPTLFDKITDLFKENMKTIAILLISITIALIECAMHYYFTDIDFTAMDFRLLLTLNFVLIYFGIKN